MNIELELNGLNCSNCADKIQNLSSELKGVKNAELNFVTKKLKLAVDDGSDYRSITKEVVRLVKELEPDVDVIELSRDIRTMELELNGLNCSDCATKIEAGARELEGAKSVDFNFVSKKLRIGLEDGVDYGSFYETIHGLINELEPGLDIVDLSLFSRTKELRFKLLGLDCIDCARNIENFTKSLKGVEDANFDFISGLYRVRIRQEISSLDTKEEIRDIIETIEPGVEIIDLDQAKGISPKKLSSKIDKKQVLTIGLAAGLALIPWILKIEGLYAFFFYLGSYLIIGNKIIRQAFKNIRAGLWFDENFLMTIATISAFVIGEYPEAIMVMLLYQIGESLQGMAVNHSRDSITALMDIRPDSVNLERKDQLVEVDPMEVRPGDIILVKPGERVALDGRVIEGNSMLDTSSITGESLPRRVGKGDEILSGVINQEGLLRVEVSKVFGESTISKILDLVENASSKKAETENFITKFSRYYTPFVVVIALAMAFLPPVFGYGHLRDWLYNASVFLVISCPCALVISVPLGFFGGLGAASKSGVLVKGGNYLEALTQVDRIAFDKTGTVTEGVFEVRELRAYEGYSQEEVLELAAHGEFYSNHPIGRSIVKSFKGAMDESRILDYKEIAGEGISLSIDNKKVLLGNHRLMESNGVDYQTWDGIGSLVYLALENKHIGTLVVADKIKERARIDLKSLKDLGIKETIMLSGDKMETVEKVAAELNIDRHYGELLPQDKVDIVEKLMAEGQDKKLIFVGDGVNDAPVLARADIGIAMGGLGSDAAIEASDIVIMTDDIGKISRAIKIARNTKKIVLENIGLALGVKLIVLILGAFGKASMWQAVFADVGVSIIAILNSIRALRLKD